MLQNFLLKIKSVLKVNGVQKVKRERMVLDREESLVQLGPWVRPVVNQCSDLLAQTMYLNEFEIFTNISNM